MEDLRVAHAFPSGRELAGAQGDIPPRAGHHEALVLSSVRLGENFVGARVSRIAILGRESGDQCLAEARHPLRNPGSFPPMLPSPGRDAPLGLCDGIIFFFSTHSIGRRPYFLKPKTMGVQRS